MTQSKANLKHIWRILLGVTLLGGALLFLTGIAFAMSRSSSGRSAIPSSCPPGYTICTVQSGDWDDPTTWSPPRIPTINDNVAILPGHHVYLPNNSGHFINSLLVSSGMGSTLEFSGAYVEGLCDVRIIATSRLINDGIIRAGAAGDRGCDVVISVAGLLTGHGLFQSGAAPGGCPIGGARGADGGDVVLIAGEMDLYSHPDFDFNILAGRSNLHSDGCSIGGHGGDISLYADGYFTATQVVVQAGRGGNVPCSGSAGSGGDIDWYGDPVQLISSVFQAGSGGHTANCPSPPPRPPRGRNRGEPPQTGTTTPNILIRGNTFLEGEAVEIYGSEGWTIAFEPIEGEPTPVISATTNITLTTGAGGTLLFNGDLPGIFNVSAPAGTIVFQSDSITSSIPLGDLAGGSTPVITSTSTVIYDVTALSANEGTVSAVVGAPFMVTFRVQNLSSVIEAFDLQFQAGDWAVSPALTTLTLNVFEVAEVSVWVTAPTPGQQTLTLQVASQTEPGRASDSVDVLLQAFATCPALSSLDFSVSGQVWFGAIRPGTLVSFAALPASSGWNMVWEFSDGMVGSGDVVARRFNIPGIYDVTLTAGNDCGSMRAVTQPIRVFYAAGLPIIYRR